MINIRIASALTMSLIFNFLATTHAAGQASSAEEEAAFKELEVFLNNPSERASFSSTRPDAQKANNFLEAFPSWVQKEIIDINMMIVREKKEGASVHVQALKSGGVGGAKQSFSPAVNARIDRMVKRLEADPAFNNPQNLGNLKSKMPMLFGSPSS